MYKALNGDIPGDEEIMTVAFVAHQGGMVIHTPTSLATFAPNISKWDMPAILLQGMHLDYTNIVYAEDPTGNYADFEITAPYYLERAYFAPFSTPEVITAILTASVGWYSDLLNLLFNRSLIGIYRRQDSTLEPSPERSQIISDGMHVGGDWWMPNSVGNTGYSGQDGSMYGGRNGAGGGVYLDPNAASMVNYLRSLVPLSENHQFALDPLSGDFDPIDPGVMFVTEDGNETGGCYPCGYGVRSAVAFDNLETPSQTVVSEKIFTSLTDVPIKDDWTFPILRVSRDDTARGNWPNYGTGYVEYDPDGNHCKSTRYANGWTWGEWGLTCVTPDGYSVLVSDMYSYTAVTVSIRTLLYDGGRVPAIRDPEIGGSEGGLIPILTGIDTLGQFGLPDGIIPGIKLWDFLGDYDQ